MEKKVVVPLCAKILTETELYDTHMKECNLIGWICMAEQIKTSNNIIRSLTGECKKDRARMSGLGVWAQLERMKELCKERNNLYKEQTDLKVQKEKNEGVLEG